MKSKEICADPAANWARKIVKELDEEKATTSPLPHGAASAAAPEELGVLQKHVGLPDTAPSQTTAPTSFFQGTSTTVLERTRVPAAGTEASITSPQATQHTTQLPAAALSTDESMDPTSARADTPNAASGSSRSGLPSTLDGVEITTVPATPVPPEASPVSTLNSPAAMDRGLSAQTNGAVSSSAGAFGTRALDYSSLVANQEPADTFVFTHQAFSGQARVQVTTQGPRDLPVPNSLSRPELPVFVPIAVVGGLVACGAAVVWHYLKFRVKPEGVAREMVQSLLYRKQGHESDVRAVGAV